MIEVELCVQSTGQEKKNRLAGQVPSTAELENQALPSIFLKEKNGQRLITLYLNEEIHEDLLDDVTSDAVCRESINLVGHLLGLNHVTIDHITLAAGDLFKIDGKENREITARIFARNDENQKLLEHGWPFVNALFLHRILGVSLMVDEDFFIKFKAYSLRERLRSISISEFGRYKLGQ